VTSVTKSNAGRHAFVFWDDVVAQVDAIGKYDPGSAADVALEQVGQQALARLKAHDSEAPSKDPTQQ